MVSNIVVIGCSGAIGGEFVKQLASFYPDAIINSFSRSHNSFNLPNLIRHEIIDYNDESSIEKAALNASKEGAIDMVIAANGILHNDSIQPEKSLKELSAEKLQMLFLANTVTPALIAKHFTPYLNKKNKSIFAAMSARVGSVSDNYLGGWYSYRASKAALNMIIKNVSIEVARRNKKAVIVGLHPGTVDSNLSKPFQANVPEGKLFTPAFAVGKLISVLNNLKTNQSGKCFDYNGDEVQP